MLRKSRTICSATLGISPSIQGGRREMQIIFVRRSGDCIKTRSICWPDIPFAPVMTAVMPLMSLENIDQDLKHALHIP